MGHFGGRVMSGIGGCEEHCPRIGNFTVIAPIDLHPRTESTRIRPIKLLLSLRPQLWGEQKFQKRWFLFGATLTWFNWNSNYLWSHIGVIPFFLSTSCLLRAIWIWGKGGLEIMLYSKIWTFLCCSCFQCCIVPGDPWYLRSSLDDRLFDDNSRKPSSHREDPSN